ncbi:response regulator [Microbacterium sp. BK668]|uniref:response regulator n=1 Tax=Microbacterium sp. BK668 TaxID=2512118 RepID=UPI00105F6573|nr:response regulator [Microbacterium sp. BK668]TDN93248.1 response regulator of citrate/malate metabolism [Microbacterium sp. BK668]
MTGGIRVLVVDDDRGARALHAGFVADTSGFVVAGTAATGAEALSQAAGMDLILLDMRMPDISGVEVLHRLRTVGGDGPDVLVISSSRDQTTVRQAMAAHVVGYLVKPFTKAALQERLELYRAARDEHMEGLEERPLAQGEIDRLLTGGIRTVRRRSDAPLPKGLAEPTLERIVAALDPVAARSAKQVAAACGMSPGTAHRYLTYLTEVGVIDLAHRYGRRGRPQVLYRLAPAGRAPRAD